MTEEEVEARLTAIEAEMKRLRDLATPAPKSWLGLYGAYADDPTFEAAMRLGREYRDAVNRQSVEELDQEEAEVKTKRAKKPAKKPAKRRGPNARS
jgi:hypothetical protein